MFFSCNGALNRQFVESIGYANLASLIGFAQQTADGSDSTWRDREKSPARDVQIRETCRMLPAQ